MGCAGSGTVYGRAFPSFLAWHTPAGQTHCTFETCTVLQWAGMTWSNTSCDLILGLIFHTKPRLKTRSMKLWKSGAELLDMGAKPKHCSLLSSSLRSGPKHSSAVNGWHQQPRTRPIYFVLTFYLEFDFLQKHSTFSREVFSMPVIKEPIQPTLVV